MKRNEQIADFAARVTQRLRSQYPNADVKLTVRRFPFLLVVVHWTGEPELREMMDSYTTAADPWRSIVNPKLVLNAQKKRKAGTTG